MATNNSATNRFSINENGFDIIIGSILVSVDIFENRTITVFDKDAKVTKVMDLGMRVARATAISEALCDIENEAEEVQNQKLPKIISDVKHLIEWKEELVRVHVYTYEKPEMGLPIYLRNRANAHKLDFFKEVVMRRRESLLANGDIQMVKLVDKNELANLLVELDKDLSLIEDDDLELGGDKLLNDSGLRKSIEKTIFPKYKDMHFTGGNADRGIMLFSGYKAVDAKAQVKLGKILLRSGIRCSFHRKLTVQFQDFSVTSPTRRDGLYGVWRKRVFDEFNEYNGIFGTAHQGHIFANTITAVKGMEKPANKELAIMFKGVSEDVDLLIDVNEWNGVFGAGMTPGQVIEIPADWKWVMSTDDRVRMKKVNASYQAMRRAPEAIANMLFKHNMNAMEDLLAAACGADKRDLYKYMPKLGVLGKMAKAGIRPFLQAQNEECTKWAVDAKYEKLIMQQVALNNAKGAKMDGYYIRVFHDDQMSIDMGNQIPGIAVPKAMKVFEAGVKRSVQLGDHVTILVYPALPAKDKEGRSPFIFVCEVESIHSENEVRLNSKNCLYGLRDEDGDRLVIMGLEQNFYTADVLKCGQALSYLSAKAEVVQTDEEKAEAKKAVVWSGNKAEDDSKSLALFLNTGSDVGKVDNMVTSAMLYLADRDLSTIVTPTGESFEDYSSKVIQGSIEVKKHAIRAEYSFRSYKKFLQTIIPDAFEITESGTKFIKHSELDVQKLSNEDGRVSSNQVTKEMLVNAIAMVPEDHSTYAMEIYRKSGEITLTENGFVKYDFYADAIDEVYDGVSELMPQKRINQLSAMVDRIYEEAYKMLALKEKDSAEKASQYLNSACQYAALTLKPIDVVAMQMLSVIRVKVETPNMKTIRKPFMWLSFCSAEFLTVIAQIAEGDIEGGLKAFGLTKRNRVTSEKFEVKVNHSSLYRVKVFAQVKTAPDANFVVGQTIEVISNTILDGTYGVKGEPTPDATYVIKAVEEVDTKSGVSTRSANLILAIV